MYIIVHVEYKGRALRKRVLVYADSDGPDQTAHLRICTVWSGQSLSSTESLDIIACMNGEQNSGLFFERAQDDLNLRILRMFEGPFSLGLAYIIHILQRSWSDSAVLLTDIHL